MRPIRVLKTESFRSAALFATLFLILSWVLLAAVYWIVNETQTSALISAIDADINTIKNGFREKGLPEAIEVVQQRLGSGDYAGADLPGGWRQSGPYRGRRTDRRLPRCTIRAREPTPWRHF